MSIQVVDGFSVTNATPVDARMVFTSSTVFSNSGSTAPLPASRRYLGMQVYVTQESQSYVLVSGDARTGGGINNGTWIISAQSASHATNSDSSSYLKTSLAEVNADGVSVTYPGDGRGLKLNSINGTDTTGSLLLVITPTGLVATPSWADGLQITDVNFQGQFTGSLHGTASFAVSASHSTNADNAISAAMSNLANQASSAYFADMAVMAEASTSASFASSSISSSLAQNAISSSYAQTASTSLTTISASYALTASFIVGGSGNSESSSWASSSLSSSYWKSPHWEMAEEAVTTDLIFRYLP